MNEEVKNLKPITKDTVYNISKDPFIIVKWRLCCSDILTSQVLANMLAKINPCQLFPSGEKNGKIYQVSL